MRARLFAFSLPIVWATGCIVVLASAGVVRTVIPYARAGRALHDTYFIVAHMRPMLWLAAMFAVFAGWYYLFPKVTGYAYSDLLGRLHFWLSFVGICLMYVPATILLADVAGGIRDFPDGFHYWNLVSSTGSYVFVAGFLVFFVNMALAFVRRRPAG